MALYREFLGRGVESAGFNEKTNKNICFRFLVLVLREDRMDSDDNKQLIVVTGFEPFARHE